MIKSMQILLYSILFSIFLVPLGKAIAEFTGSLGLAMGFIVTFAFFMGHRSSHKSFGSFPPILPVANEIPCQTLENEKNS